MENNKLLIEATNIGLKINGNNIINDVSLNIHSGELVFLAGKNGSGKSTLFNIISGRVDSFNGKRKILGSVAYHEQRPVFLTNMSSIENLECFNKIFRCNYSLNELMDLLRKVGLQEECNTYANNMSGGEKQRLSLAITLLRDRDIYLFDEADSAMDPKGRRFYFNILKDLKERGKGILWISHHIRESLLVSDRGLYLNNGVVDEFNPLLKVKSLPNDFIDEDFYELYDKKKINHGTFNYSIN